MLSIGSQLFIILLLLLLFLVSSSFASIRSKELRHIRVAALAN